MANMTYPRGLSGILMMVFAIALVVAAIYAMNHTRDDRTPGERLTDAVDELQDKTPLERAGDRLENAVETK